MMWFGGGWDTIQIDSMKASLCWLFGVTMHRQNVQKRNKLKTKKSFARYAFLVYPFKLEFTTKFYHFKPRIATAILDL